jgi:hypothetical protein
MVGQRCHCWLLLVVVAACLSGAPAHGQEQAPPPARVMQPPAWLPKYDLEIHLDLAQHQVVVHQRTTWTNRHQRPAQEIVYNAHSHYAVPKGDGPLLAKTLEILRVNPEESMESLPPPLDVQRVRVGDHELAFHYRDDNVTALTIPLPQPVAQGETIVVDMDFVLRLPQRQGRWGQWQDVTFLATWLPVLAYYDENGWQPTPFVPWHQPFFNEAGVYTARLTLPRDQKVACTGSVIATRELDEGLKQLDITANGVRDFAIVASARFQELTGDAGPVKVKCLAFPEHEYHARAMLKTVCDCIPVYTQWFGPYPYPEFTIVESFFGWNGNECGTLVMIDERIFGAPHIADGFVEYLVSHETCHQWWYNVVGTNGYCETWMDEGLATYFSHRYIDCKHGKNSQMIHYPSGLEWMPNIHRDNYRSFGMYGVYGRGDQKPVVQEMPQFGHLVNLLGMCYDKGSRIVGIIEDRLGEAAFFDFMRTVYAKYQYGMLRVADFQRELELYTGRSWKDFFDHWLYGCGLPDWAVQSVKLERVGTATTTCPKPGFLNQLHAKDARPYNATILVEQKGDFNEATMLGICLDGGDHYQIRIPIDPEAGPVQFDDPPARVECVNERLVKIEVLLPCKPTQITVDPDKVLVDRDPTNNCWRTPVRVRATPLYTLLDETGMTADYDKYNLTYGPWISASAYDDPWYPMSPLAGVRLGLYRTDFFKTGVYAAYRANDRNLVAGVDGLVDHWPWPHTQFGFNAERSLTNWNGDDRLGSRAMLFGRYVFQYTPSLYLPPMHYVEAYTSFRDHFLPDPENTVPGADHFDHQTTVGLHYHLDYLTPYWDPEGGFRLDASVEQGIPILGEKESFTAGIAQFSTVKGLPEGWGWLSDTRIAMRLAGAAALPNKGEFFALGGGEMCRGFDVTERQGSLLWLASLEWRVPLIRGVTWDCCDHVAGVRNVYAAAFYDVGDVYVKGHSLGPVAHAVGAGLRVDVAWFSFVERTTIRFDVAKSVNTDNDVQFWLGLQHPF